MADSLALERSAPHGSRPHASAGFTRFALIVLAGTVAVILFGAIVRITGSGAGCGQHWPTCHGEIVHLPRKVETAIELGHRTSSGLAMLAVFALTAVAFRSFKSGHPVRRAAVASSVMMIVEALVGAGLVLFQLVEGDTSVARTVVMPLHLVSTSLLTAALALVFWWSVPRAARAPSGDPRTVRMVWLGIVGVLAVSSTGAITALGDTVYPVTAAPLSERIAELQASSSHFLERLRVIHPVLSVLVAAQLFRIGSAALERLSSRAAGTFARSLIALTATQMLAGGVNVLLSAPGWMQVVHLLLATVLWIVLVLLGAEAARPRTASA